MPQISNIFNNDDMAISLQRESSEIEKECMHVTREYGDDIDEY
jgi:hypothetical protein